MNIRRFVPIFTFVVATGVVSGCGGALTEPTNESSLTIAGITGQDAQNSDEWYRDQETRIHEVIARCMGEQGWEYIPYRLPDAVLGISDEDEMERRQQVGYGVTYWVLNLSAGAALEDGATSDWVDPNTAVVEAMSEEERTAYYESLYGTPEEQGDNLIVDIDPETGEEFRTWLGYGPGCQGEAYEEVLGEDPTLSEEYWTMIARFYEELYLRIESDPRIKALDREWVACMSGLGYDYGSFDEIASVVIPDFQRRVTEITGDLYTFDPFEGWTDREVDDFFGSASQEEINALYTSAWVLTEDQIDRMEGLLAEEIEIAVAEYTCSEPRWEEYQSIFARIEEAYTIEHQAEIEALMASLGGAE